MLKSVISAFIILCAVSPASAQYQATFTQDFEYETVTIRAGTDVDVSTCLITGRCLATVEGVSVLFPADIATAIVGGEQMTLQEAEDAKWEAIQAADAARRDDAAHRPPSRTIRMEGDSYMTRAMHEALQDATVRRVVTTAVGGSTMDEIASRMTGHENSGYSNDVTVFWDGSHNGLREIGAYADQLQAAIDALSHDRFLVIPPMYGDQIGEVADEFHARWPDNVLDWRDLFGDFEGAIPSELLRENDDRHINRTAQQEVAAEIMRRIEVNGW